MQVLKFNDFTVHIYTTYPPPHCHVRFNDGEEILVSIPAFTKIAGNRALTREIEACLLENIDFICTKLD